MHWAAAQGHIGVAALLLAFGADANGCDAQGKTPLQIAVEEKHAEIVALLKLMATEVCRPSYNDDADSLQGLITIQHRQATSGIYQTVASKDTQKLEGTVSRIVYHNAANGYTVLALQSGAAQVTAVGNMLVLAEGESLRLHGAWVDTRKYGRQFEFEHYELVRSVTAEAIVAYLGARPSIAHCQCE